MKEREYRIFEGKKIIHLNKSLVEFFEEYQGELTTFYVEHLADIEGMDENTPKRELEVAISKALVEELEVLSQIIPDFQEMFRKGLLQ